MRANVGAGIVAGILVAVAYGIVVQIATLPAMDGASMPGGAMAGDAMAARREPMILMVARLIRSDSLAAAWTILLLAGVAMGGLFGVLFGRRIESLRGALAWGVFYGFLWWIAAALLFMPVALGMAPFAPITMAPMRSGALIGLGAWVLAGIILGTVFFLVRRRRTMVG